MLKLTDRRMITSTVWMITSYYKSQIYCMAAMQGVCHVPHLI